MRESESHPHPPTHSDGRRQLRTTENGSRSSNGDTKPPTTPQLFSFTISLKDSQATNSDNYSKTEDTLLMLMSPENEISITIHLASFVFIMSLTPNFTQFPAKQKMQWPNIECLPRKKRQKRQPYSNQHHPPTTIQSHPTPSTIISHPAPYTTKTTNLQPKWEFLPRHFNKNFKHKLPFHFHHPTKYRT